MFKLRAFSGTHCICILLCISFSLCFLTICETHSLNNDVRETPILDSGKMSRRSKTYLMLLKD